MKSRLIFYEIKQNPFKLKFESKYFFKIIIET